MSPPNRPDPLEGMIRSALATPPERDEAMEHRIWGAIGREVGEIVTGYGRADRARAAERPEAPLGHRRERGSSLSNRFSVRRARRAATAAFALAAGVLCVWITVRVAPDGDGAPAGVVAVEGSSAVVQLRLAIGALETDLAPSTERSSAMETVDRALDEIRSAMRASENDSEAYRRHLLRTLELKRDLLGRRRTNTRQGGG